MVRSLYKGERLGKDPLCLICMGRAGVGEPSCISLKVSVWLCGAHRSPEFLRRRAGRDLVVSLQRAWEASGQARPGSYAWPELRREAERRAAAGQAPRRIVAELLARAAGGLARAPARRTMLR
jgi:hypothetical protein